ncbi:MAG: hypothetical protein ACYCW6_17880 [Candidatus Xenobia bacterium]
MSNSCERLLSRRDRVLAIRVAGRLEEGIAELYATWGRQFAGEALGRLCGRLGLSATRRSLMLRSMSAQTWSHEGASPAVDVLGTVRTGLQRVWRMQLEAGPELTRLEVLEQVRELESAPFNAAVDWLLHPIHEPTPADSEQPVVPSFLSGRPLPDLLG